MVSVPEFTPLRLCGGRERSAAFLLVAVIFRVAECVWQCAPPQCVLPGPVTTIAGEDDHGYEDNVGTLARFYQPEGVAFYPDGSRVVVGSMGNDVVRIIELQGQVTTLAGTAGCSGTGESTDPCFNNPTSVDVSPDGLLVAVSEETNARIRLVNGSGYTTILSGSGYSSSAVDGLGTDAKWRKPGPLAFSPDGQYLAVIDESMDTIRFVDVPSGQTRTVLGDGTSAYEEGTGTRAQFKQPHGIAFSPDGEKLAIVDRGEHILRIADLNTMTTRLLAGDPDQGGKSVDGPFKTGRFYNPNDVAWSPDGNHLAVVDQYKRAIRVVEYATGSVSTIAGDIDASSTRGWVDDTGTSARFMLPQGVAWNADGKIVVTDYSTGVGHAVRLIAPTCGACPEPPADTTTPEPEADPSGSSLQTYIYVAVVGVVGVLISIGGTFHRQIRKALDKRRRARSENSRRVAPAEGHAGGEAAAAERMEEGKAREEAAAAIGVSGVPSWEEGKGEAEEAPRLPGDTVEEWEGSAAEESSGEREGEEEEEEGAEAEADEDGGWGVAAGEADVGSSQSTDPKFAARTLVLGHSEEAAAGLKAAVGLDVTQVFANLLKQGLDAIESEFFDHGSEEDQDNFNYVVKGTAGAEDSLPRHVRQQIEQGWYHGGALGVGEFDEGHEGWGLMDFVNHEHSQIAGLQVQHVVALRLYTTTSYRRFNAPMRNREKPHPFRMSVYFLDEGLRKLRQVGARLDPASFSEVKYLWRGMHRMRLDASFLQLGGTELAPMSTTTEKAVALKYAGGESPLVFKYKTRGLGRGVSIRFLSVYPREEEYLYPPLTFLQPEGKPKVIRGVTVVEVTPQMS